MSVAPPPNDPLVGQGPQPEVAHHESIHELLEYLRLRPNSQFNAAQLAERFGIGQTFAEQVLQRIHDPLGSSDTRRLRIDWAAVQAFFASLLTWFDRLFAKPVRFVAVSSLFAVSLGIACTLVLKATLDPGLRGPVIITTDSIIALTVIAIHMVGYLRLGMVRYALYGTGAMYLAVGAPSTIYSVITTKDDVFTRLLAGSAMLLLMMLFAFFYALISCMMALIGGWVHHRQQEADELHMDRQELLARYFELENRLPTAVESRSDTGWSTRKGIQWLRRNPVLASIIGATILTLPSVFTGPPVAARSGRQELELTFLAVGSIVSIVSFAFLGFVAFLAGKPLRAALVGLVFNVTGGLVGLLPGGNTSVLLKTQPGAWIAFPAGAFITVLFTTLCGLGAKIQQSATDRLRLNRNEAAAIVAEMVRIHWRLGAVTNEITVMVVDAAKSSQMKMEADPMLVEFSFREYQEWILETSAELGGRVHSTAGDGAVVAFSAPENAVSAACRLQADIDRFNREQSRLKTPFRLRIGLHRGNIAGDLDDVVFTEVIDIAAHVEGAAPVGGVAITRPVAERIVPREMVPLARRIDGHEVFFLLDPSAQHEHQRPIGTRDVVSSAGVS